MSFKIDIKIELQKLEKDIEQLSKDTISVLKAEVKEISKGTYTHAQRLAIEKLNTSRDVYLDNLEWKKVGTDVYEVYLVQGSKAEYFEDGMDAFNVRKGLKSGSTKISKDGHKYRDIPFQVKPTAKDGTGTGTGGQKITDIRSAVAATIKDKDITKKVREYNRNINGENKKVQVTKYTGMKDKSVDGLTKVKMGKTSKYFLFRRISENPNSPGFKDKWNHPGFKGINIFDNELPKYAQKQIDKMLKKIFG